MKSKNSNPIITQESLIRSIADRVEAARKSREDVIPPGWYNAEELGKIMGVSKETVLRQMKTIGAPTKRFRRATATNLRWVHYWKP